MADKKITALDELTTLADGDLFVVVDDAAGTPVSKKVSFETIVDFVAASEDISTAIQTVSPPVAFDDANNVLCNAVFL